MTTPTPINPEELAASYGWSAAVMNSSPDLKAVFDQAVAETWSPARFVAAVQSTGWFKSTSESARKWFMVETGDPAEANRQLLHRADAVNVLSSQLGVTLPAGSAERIARDSLTFGWDDDQVRRNVAQNWNFVGGSLAGAAGQTVAALHKTANDYLVPLSNETVQKWGQDILAGRATAEDFAAYTANTAKSMFPALANEIDRGITIQQYAEPYKQTAAKLLEIAPDSVNLMDPKWRRALEARSQGGSGEATTMSLSEWETTLRTSGEYGYDKTSGARQAASELTGQLAQAFGVRG